MLVKLFIPTPILPELLLYISSTSSVQLLPPKSERGTPLPLEITKLSVVILSDWLSVNVALAGTALSTLKLLTVFALLDAME